MIEDLDGITSEPTRRRHVAVLSAAVASVALVLVVALLVPAPRVDTPPLAASPAPSASAGTVMTIASNPISQLRLDLTRASVCPDGTRLDPPYHLAVDAVTGQIFAGRVDGGARVMRVLSVPVTLALDARTGRVTVSCATSEVFAPWDGP